MLNTRRNCKWDRVFHFNVSSQLHIQGHDGNPFSMDSGVWCLKRDLPSMPPWPPSTNESWGLEPNNSITQSLPPFLSEQLEGQLVYQKIGRLLVALDFPQVENIRPVPAVPLSWGATTFVKGFYAVTGIPDTSSGLPHIMENLELDYRFFRVKEKSGNSGSNRGTF